MDVETKFEEEVSRPVESLGLSVEEAWEEVEDLDLSGSLD